MVPVVVLQVALEAAVPVAVPEVLVAALVVPEAQLVSKSIHCPSSSRLLTSDLIYRCSR